jgi:predicted small metal-binding protein
MSKQLACKDFGHSCAFVAKGETVEDILPQVAKHATEVHKMQVTPELVAAAKSKIREA